MEVTRDPFPQLEVWRRKIPTSALRFERDLQKAIDRYKNPRKRTFYDKAFVAAVVLGKPDALVFVVPVENSYREDSFAIERLQQELWIYMRGDLGEGTPRVLRANLNNTSFGLSPSRVLLDSETEIPSPDPAYHQRGAVRTILSEVLLSHTLMSASQSVTEEIS